MSMLTMAAAAAATFNLVCAGTIQTRSNGDKTEPYSYTYRLDLDAKEFCDGECKGRRPIAEVAPAQITLVEEDVDTPRERRFHLNRIDRETGKHTIVMVNESRVIGDTIIEWTGQCEKAPFTGFPEVSTKF